RTRPSPSVRHLGRRDRAMATQKQIEANQGNSQHSTGPRCTEHTRGNALKLGLSGPGVVLPEEMAREVNLRFHEHSGCLRPFDTYDEWLVEQITIESVRADNCQRHLVALVHEQSQRAKTSWDEDRALEAESIAKRLAQEPGEALLRLLAFKQGAQ